METLRLFVAALLPSGVSEEISAYQMTLDREMDGEPIRWIPRHNLHLTIQFLGETPAERLDTVNEALTTAAAVLAGNRQSGSSIDLRLAGAGAFPRLSRPRTIWVGLDGNLAPLTDLNLSIRHELDLRGISYDAKSFRPHITIGYVRNNRPRDVVRGIGPIIESSATPRGAFTVDEIHLIASELGPTGARYRTVFRMPL